MTTMLQGKPLGWWASKLRTLIGQTPMPHTFPSHTDVPAYAGNAGKYPKVNVGEDAVEWDIEAFAAHNILSAGHGDALAANVVDGDVVIGNVTPKWSRLAIAIPAATFRNVLGIDNAELRPSWKALFDDQVATTVQPDDAAAAGTATAAARRDHTHGFATVAPSDIGNANAEGTDYDFVRSDHVHNHPAALGVDLHHNEVHVVNSTGPHAEAGLTIGHVLRVSAADAFSFAALIATDLPAHNILSAQHGDSLTAGVTRGSIIYGNATPKWAELTVGDAGDILGTDGTDVAWVSTATPAAHNLLSAQHGDTTTDGPTRGSIIYSNDTPAWDELVVGDANQYLGTDGTDAAWAQVEHTQLGGVTSDLHHNDGHVVNSTGPHVEAGLTIGHVLRVSGAAAFSFAALIATDLPAHNLLGTQHGDTVADDPSRGSIVYGNATPKWDELTVGGAGDILGTDGTDVAWVSSATPAAHNLLDAEHGDTTTDGPTRGSIIYSNSTPAWDELTVGAVHTHLESDGTDAAWVLPDIYGTPGTCTVATANVAGSTHSHAITTSSNPGPTALILASTAAGHLQLFTLDVERADTETAEQADTTLYVEMLADPAAASSTTFLGIRVRAYSDAGCAENIQELTGLTSAVFHDGSGTVTVSKGGYGIVRNEGGGTITELYGWSGGAYNPSGNTIGTAKLLAARCWGGGTCTTMYGLYIEALDATTTWGIYQVGSADKNYLAASLFINDIVNTKQSIGLTINQGAYDDEILGLKSSDVAHGMTDYAETDTFASFKKIEAIAGGLQIAGWKDADGGLLNALNLFGGLGEAASTTKSAAAHGVISLEVGIETGTTCEGVGANGNLVVIKNWGSTRFVFDAEGEMHSDDIIGVGDDWDDWDDLALATDLSRLPKAKFDEMMRYNAEDFERAGLLTLSVDEDGKRHAFIRHKAFLQFYACCFADVYYKFKAHGEDLAALKNLLTPLLEAGHKESAAMIGK